MVLAKQLTTDKIDKVLLVSDQGIVKLGLLDELLEKLESLNIEYFIYSDTVSNPTVTNVEDAKKVYLDNSCQAVIAFGGGSVIDCAKAAATLVVKPNKTIKQLKGLLKVLKKLPPTYIIPTTAGSGSETTLAAVISDNQSHEKYVIYDFSLIPNYTVLNPQVTVGLPKNITAYTGMDALTHALEAYIGRSNTKETKELSEMAIKLIYKNIQTAYDQGDNLEARSQMLIASYYAGAAFTKAYIGYAHSLSHAIGGKYNLAHGLLNAILLPQVLEAYGNSVDPALAKVAKLLEFGEISDSDRELASLVIKSIYDLNTSLNIPNYIEELREDDLKMIVNLAYKETNPLYPVPKILNRDELENILRKLIK